VPLVQEQEGAAVVEQEGAGVQERVVEQVEVVDCKDYQVDCKDYQVVLKDLVHRLLQQAVVEVQERVVVCQVV
jgi:hypothetical protein